MEREEAKRRHRSTEGCRRDEKACETHARANRRARFYQSRPGKRPAADQSHASFLSSITCATFTTTLLSSRPSALPLTNRSSDLDLDRGSEHPNHPACAQEWHHGRVRRRQAEPSHNPLRHAAEEGSRKEVPSVAAPLTVSRVPLALAKHRRLPRKRGHGDAP